MHEYSTPAVVDIPESDSLANIVFDRATGDPSQVVMRRKAGPSLTGVPPAASHISGPWQDVTAGAFAAEVAALAKGLMAAGIGAGDRVALMSRTRYEWTVADYAIWAAGAVTVPIYETSSAEQVEWILTDSGARALIIETPGHLASITEVLRRLPDVSLIWLIESDGCAAGSGWQEADSAVGGPDTGSATRASTSMTTPARASTPQASRSEVS